MPKCPKASICVPIYNSAQFLRECLKSILNQTVDDYEVVLSIDQGSSDDSENIIKEFAGPRIRVLKPQQHLGAGENIRYAVNASRGEYFNFRGPNDNLFPEFLELQIKILDQNPKVAFVHSASEIVDLNGKLVNLAKSLNRSFVRPGNKEIKRYLAGPKAHGDTFLVRRSAYDKVGGFGPRMFFADWELALRLLCYGDVAYNDKVLNQNRSWGSANSDHDKHHTLEKKLESLKMVADFYDFYEPYVLRYYPDMADCFTKARCRRALIEIHGLKNFNGFKREEAIKHVLNISKAWPVHVKLFLHNFLGLAFLWQLHYDMDSWIKFNLKKMLFFKICCRKF